MLDRTQEYAKMAEVEQTLWWYQALHHLVLATLRKHTPGRDIEILDAGCGTGGLMMFLREHGYQKLRGFDLSDAAVAWCTKRGLDVHAGNLTDIGTHAADRSADAIVSNDTLCYLDESGQAHFVEQCARILRSGGLLLLNVPALRVFAGIHDLSVGIRCRFSRADSGRLLPARWFEVARECYWPFVLSPPILVARAAQRRTMRRDPAFEVRSDIDLPPRWLNSALSALVRAENRLLSKKPLGSSLFLVGRRRSAG